MKKLFASFLIFFLIHQLSAQEQRVFSQFFMNPYIYNPAYVGVEGHTAFFVMYRAQYSGLQGGPSFSHATIHSPLKGGIGIGGMVFNEVEGGILKTSGFKASAGYLAAFDRKHYLRFGMSLGAGTTTLDNSDPDLAADIFNDPAFANLSNKYMIADFGMTYHFGHFNVGLSIPNLVSREVISSESFSPIKISPMDNMLFKMNYRGHIGHDFAIEPHLLYRYSNITTSQYEAAVIMHLKHIVWVGGSYREGAGMNALLGFKVKERIGIGYAMELGNSKISSITGTTHEFHIGYHISGHKKHHGHHSSFIKSHKLTAEERAKLAEKRRLKEEEKERREQERLARLNETKEEKPAETEQDTAPAEDNAIVQPEHTQREETTPPANQGNTAGTNRNTANTTNTGGNTETPATSNTPSTTNTPAAEKGNTNPATNYTKATQPTRVRKGTHFLELPQGHHVIAGAFKEFEHAENYSDKMFERGFHDTIVGYQSEKGYYYVVLFRSDNNSVAIKQRNKARAYAGLNDVWILTVE